MNELTVKLEDISVSFGNKHIFDIEQMSAYMNDRIAIVGRNGSGKSTLLKIIAGVFEGYTGEVQRETDFNYLSQIGDPKTEISESLDFEMLSRMNIPGNNNLSGGEETKYRIVQTLSDYKMGLLLDEPTNFIDLMTIEALEKFIRAYQGTIILTSHDRQLISRTADRVYTIFEKNLIDIT